MPPNCPFPYMILSAPGATVSGTSVPFVIARTMPFFGLQNGVGMTLISMTSAAFVEQCRRYIDRAALVSCFAGQL